MSRATRQASGERGQCYLEVGFGTGELARAFDFSTGFGSVWIKGDLMTDAYFTRRLVGWIGSRSVRALALVLPALPRPDAALGLSRLALAAVKTGTACVCISHDVDHADLHSPAAVLEAAGGARTYRFAACQSRAGGRHDNFRITALGAGDLPWLSAPCTHRHWSTDAPRRFPRLHSTT